MTAQTPPSSPHNTYIKPSLLKEGDHVAIVAPAGIVKDREAAIDKAQFVDKTYQWKAK